MDFRGPHYVAGANGLLPPQPSTSPLNFRIRLPSLLTITTPTPSASGRRRHRHVSSRTPSPHPRFNQRIVLEYQQAREQARRQPVEGHRSFNSVSVNPPSETSPDHQQQSHRNSRRDKWRRPFRGIATWTKTKAQHFFGKTCPVSRTRLTPEPQPRTGHGADMPSRVRQPAAAATASQAGPARDPANMRTGNCMTCAALMRWPKEKNCFRCAICATINNLVPLPTVPAANPRSGPHGREGGRSALMSAPAQNEKTSGPRPISLTTTRSLVVDSIYSYLAGEFCTANTGPLDTTHTKVHDRLSIRAPTSSPKFVFPEPPTLQLASSHASSSSQTSAERAQATVYPVSQCPDNTPAACKVPPGQIFDRVQAYIKQSFTFENLSSSFLMPARGRRSHSGNVRMGRPVSNAESRMSTSSTDTRPADVSPVCEVDPKTLLLGTFAENGSWWTGNQAAPPPPKPCARGELPYIIKPSPINWQDVVAWYSGVVYAAGQWRSVLAELAQRPDYITPSPRDLDRVASDLEESQERLRRSLLKITENLLKSPGGLITESEQVRCLLILMENPLLHWAIEKEDGSESARSSVISSQLNLPSTGPMSGRHSGIIKRVVGLISNLSPELHTQLIAHWSRSHPERFVRTKDLVFGFLTYRLIRTRPESITQQSDIESLSDLVPYLEPGSTGSSLHHDIGNSSRIANPSQRLNPSTYAKDWQLKAACRVLSLLFDANHPGALRRIEEAALRAREPPLLLGKRHSNVEGLFVSMSDFYSTIVDYVDFAADFKAWESKQSFSFCQYPFLLSLWAKTEVLEHDMRRQMRDSAREAFFDSVMHRREISQVLSLDVRRECIVDDSLTAIGESLGSQDNEAKKALRITFRGEDGIDGGGLRKEWFLLLVREIFNPERGLFTYDEHSRYCYFNPYTFETSKEFYLIGAIMGLAIYNSTILDIPFPPFLFRKLMASFAVVTGRGSNLGMRESMRYSLEDLAQYKPALAKGLRHLLDCDEDVEETFNLDFTVPMNRNGKIEQVPLCDKGETRSVTNKNRKEYVDLYVRYLLDESVKKHFDPFKRGFYTVCSGNAFCLFRPEEVELLLRGTDEPLEVSTLRGVATYDGWNTRQPDGDVPLISWFWELFEEASAEDQRSLLLFITGSDRLPAAGAAMLSLRINYQDKDPKRFPIARTCFNLLSLPEYKSKQKLSYMLWRAVREGGGFGLK